jgi:outer membrane lipase/esterase
MHTRKLSNEAAAPAPPVTPGNRVQSRRRAALRLATAVIAPAAVLGAMAAPARAQFTAIYGFGDSYADTGAGPGGAFRLAYNGVAPYFCVYVYPNCSFTGGTTFVQSLQTIYRLPTMTNYAIGGARTDNTNTLDLAAMPQPNFPIGGFKDELLWSANVRYRSTDLIALSIGGNDLSGINIPSYVPDSAAAKTVIVEEATKSAERAVAGVQQMVNSGARNIAWLSTGTSSWFPERTLGGNGTIDFTNKERDAWADTYLQKTQQMLLPLAQSGVRIFLFNFGILQERVAHNPGMYGFTSAEHCEVNGALPHTPGCFYQNSVHPTAEAMALIARFMANQIDAPTTVVPQGGIATSIATGFADTTLGRLDAERTFMPYGFGPAMAYAVPAKAPAGLDFPVAADKRWSLFSNVTYAGGSRDGQFAASSYDYSSVGGTLGVDYRFDRNWRFGGVFGYSQPDIKLAVQDAHNRIDAYQFAAFGSYTSTNWFGDALLGYGRQQMALSRQGITDTLTANTHANVFTVAARGGYLADIGVLRAGPIAGITYIHADIDRYNESGDELLAMIVDRQTIEALTGSAGLQLRYPFQFGNGLYNPFVNVTVEHDFTGSGRVVTTTLVSAPLLPILTSVPDAGSRTYGKVAAGIAAAVAGNLTVTVTGSTTFARDSGNDFGVSTGIKMAF